MNRKILMSGVSIFGALAIMGGATFAAFDSQASITGNTFATGNADLLIATDTGGSPDTYGPSIAGFSPTGVMFPGYTEDFKFWLRNASTSEIGLSTIAKLVSVVGTNEELQDSMSLKFTCTRGDDTVTVAGPFTVNQWEAGQAGVGTVFAPGDGLDNGDGTDEAMCVMTASLSPTADNDVEGTTVDFNVQFNAAQVPGEEVI